jgi:TolB-like protein
MRLRRTPQLRSRSVRSLAVVAVVASAIVAASSGVASASPGRQLWVERYDRIAGTDFATDAAVSPDGSTVFVTGGSLTTSENHDIATFAYAASTGTKEWEARYGDVDTFDVASAIAVSPDGSKVFVTGTSNSFETNDDFVTVAYAAATGRQLWVRRYTRASDTVDRAATVLVSPDSKTVFVTGQSHSSSSAVYVTFAYAAAGGTRLWRTVSDGSTQADAMALSPGGSRVFITGGIGTASSLDLETIALDASTGATVWNETFNGEANGDDTGTAIGVGPSGSKVFVTGRSDEATSGGDFATIAYGAADGSERWVARFHAPGEIYSAMGLAVAPNGSRIVVTGSGMRGGHEQYVTVAYGASGAQAWADRYDGPVHKNSYSTDVEISPDSSHALVTGASWSATHGYNFATISYGVTHGPTQWIRRYDGPDGLTDKASAVAIGPKGSRAFVVGDSDSVDRLTDYLTVAYDLR